MCVFCNVHCFLLCTVCHQQCWHYWFPGRKYILIWLKHSTYFANEIRMVFLEGDTGNWPRSYCLLFFCKPVLLAVPLWVSIPEHHCVNIYSYLLCSIYIVLYFADCKNWVIKNGFFFQLIFLAICSAKKKRVAWESNLETFISSVWISMLKNNSVNS